MLQIKEFFDKTTWTLSYVVWNPVTLDALVIDPVLDYDPASSKISQTALTPLMDWIDSHQLKLDYILETHAHADHLSGSQVLLNRYPRSKLAIGAHITQVQEVFKEVFHLPKEFRTDGSQFDRLLKDGEVFHAGAIEIKTIFTPGHTPACVSYLVDGEHLFTGDALFMPDYGTGRCDFPKGSAEELYYSIHHRIYTLPDHVKVYTGHDYMPGGRSLQFMSTIGDEKKHNIQIQSKTTQEEFVKFRTERDRTLAAPRLLLASVQVNIAGGRLPEPESNGQRYLKIPVRT